MNGPTLATDTLTPQDAYLAGMPSLLEAVENEIPVRPQLPTTSCARRKRRPPPWITLHLLSPPKLKLILGGNCSDKPGHFIGIARAKVNVALMNLWP